jgi:hypothetical protein
MSAHPDIQRSAGIDGRKTDPGKMFEMSLPGQGKPKKKKANSRFLNFV